MTNKRNNILLVSGTGQNCGKTSFICDLITQLKDQIPIVSIKISPHFHPQSKETVYVIRSNNLEIIRENKKDGRKDSNRMLKAGSKEVYYIQAKDAQLHLVLDFIDRHISSKHAIICESGGLNKLIQAGLFVEMFRSDYPNQKMQKNPDLRLEYNSNKYHSLLKDINFKNQTWQLKNKNI